MLSSKQWNNKASDIKLVCLYSTIKTTHGPINLTFKVSCVIDNYHLKCRDTLQLPTVCNHSTSLRLSTAHRTRFVCYNNQQRKAVHFENHGKSLSRNHEATNTGGALSCPSVLVKAIQRNVRRNSKEVPYMSGMRIAHRYCSAGGRKARRMARFPVNATGHQAVLFNILAQDLFLFLILAHPVYKLWIMQVPNTLELWNKLHFEEEKTESIYRV